MTEDQQGRIMAGALVAGLLWFMSKRARAEPAPAPTSGAPGAPPVHGERSALEERIKAGERDENTLTDIVFFSRHPERRFQPIEKHETELAAEWLGIRDRIVRPALEFGTGGASGTF